MREDLILHIPVREFQIGYQRHVFLLSSSYKKSLQTIFTTNQQLGKRVQGVRGKKKLPPRWLIGSSVDSGEANTANCTWEGKGSEV